jgi:hypothetical protein
MSVLRTSKIKRPKNLTKLAMSWMSKPRMSQITGELNAEDVVAGGGKSGPAQRVEITSGVTAEQNGSNSTDTQLS